MSKILPGATQVPTPESELANVCLRASHSRPRLPGESMSVVTDIQIQLSDDELQLQYFELAGSLVDLFHDAIRIGASLALAQELHADISDPKDAVYDAACLDAYRRFEAEVASTNSDLCALTNVLRDREFMMRFLPRTGWKAGRNN